MTTSVFHVSAAARNDIVEALLYSDLRFGPTAKSRYTDLIARTLTDISEQPFGVGSHERRELGDGIFARHTASSSHGTGVTDPRHIVFYRVAGDRIEVLRVLHDARDVPRHF